MLEPVKFKDVEEREDHFRDNYTKLLGEIAVNDMINKGFLTAPASTKYHGAYEGGLYDHSVNVARTLLELTVDNNLHWQDDSNRSPLVIGITHDLCKIDQYTPNLDGFIYNNTPVVKGHGMKSVIYAQAMGIRLNAEERACMIYHMGAFTDKEEWGDYTNAIHVYPNVLWTHQADMIATHIMEV